MGGRPWLIDGAARPATIEACTGRPSPYPWPEAGPSINDARALLTPPPFCFLELRLRHATSEQRNSIGTDSTNFFGFVTLKLAADAYPYCDAVGATGGYDCLSPPNFNATPEKILACGQARTRRHIGSGA